MSSPAIRVENLSKQYKIGQRAAGEYRTLRESLTHACAAPFRRFRHLRAPFSTDNRQPTTDNSPPDNRQLTTDNSPPDNRQPTTDNSPSSFWALNDVSFDVQPGEVVGIIGRNGAGKSTLLKVLSRITEPTAGRVEIRGRVASLLEVGTGFHPELTGRENVYMNGAILGMSKRDITRRFDEIIDFSEIEKFIDTPVKRYSSGMYVRLAFAVAAHLDPEILIVDEVLAVGDMAFQRKCLGQMKAIGRSGRTVIFVSHNIAALESLCQNGVLIRKGRIAGSGNVADVLREYQRHALGSAHRASPCGGLPGDGRNHSHFRELTLVDENDEPTNFVPLGGPFRCRIDVDTTKPIDSPKVGIGVDNMLGQRLLTVHTPSSRDCIGTIGGPSRIYCEIPHLPLAPGEYTLRVALTESLVEIDALDEACHFHVENGDAFKEGRGFHRGLCIASSNWHSYQIQDSGE